jgi:hypothetical protein
MKERAKRHLMTANKLRVKARTAPDAAVKAHYIALAKHYEKLSDDLTKAASLIR